MRIRNGFVSNSSSSSFIVISHGPITPIQFADNTVNVGAHNGGECEFEWSRFTYYDFLSKLNFCVLQIEYKRSSDWLVMLINVLQEVCGKVYLRNMFKYDEFEGKYYIDDGFIDHASAASEGACIEMFADENTLKQFLFCNDSYIQTCNDNE